MEQQQPVIETENTFSEAYQRFSQTTLSKRLKEKFTPKPYYEKYKIVRLLALIASYLFNSFSAITASTLVYFFIQSVTDHVIVSIACTGLFLVLLEISKRKTNSILFKDYLQFKKYSIGLIFISLLLLSVSVCFSYWGSKKLVQELHHEAEVINPDTLTMPIMAQLKDIDSQIKDARSTKWKGTTTTTSQRTIEALSKQKLALQQRLVQIENKTDAKNDIVVSDHKRAVYLKSEYFGIITFLLEVLFLITAFYLEYYDFRSYTEFARPSSPSTSHQDFVYTKNIDTSTPKAITIPEENITEDHHNITNDNNKITAPDHTPQTVIIDNTSKEAIHQAIKHVKGRISTAEHRLRNRIGKPDTAIRNIEKYKAEFDQLNMKLLEIS